MALRIRVSKEFAELVKQTKQEFDFRNDPVTTKFIAINFKTPQINWTDYHKKRKQFIEPL